MQSKFGMGLLALSMVCGASAQFDGIKVTERFWNDSPGSNLVITNDYPNLVRFAETGLNNGYANQHRWAFSADGGATNYGFGTDEYWEFACDYRIDSNNPTIRKEGGIITDGIGGDGKIMIASEGEIAMFGGPFPFYTFNDQSYRYTAGTWIKIRVRYYFNPGDSTRYIQFFAGDKQTPPMIFSNLEYGIPPGHLIGGFAQPQANAAVPQSATFQWANIKAYSLKAGYLTGKVVLGDYSGGVLTSVPVQYEIREPGTLTVVQSGTTNLSMTGTYEVATSLTGKYDVALKASHWLRTTAKDVMFDTTGTGGVDATLVNGDVDDDNSVTVFDYGVLSDAFDSSSGSGNWDARADLDGDGAVTVFDYGILSDNFDKSGDA